MNQNTITVKTVIERRQILRTRLSHLATEQTRSAAIRDLLYSLAKNDVWDACEVYRSFQQDRSLATDTLLWVSLHAFGHRRVIQKAVIPVAYGSLILQAHCAPVGHNLVLTTKIIYAKRATVEASQEVNEEGK